MLNDKKEDRDAVLSISSEIISRSFLNSHYYHIIHSPSFAVASSFARFPSLSKSDDDDDADANDPPLLLLLPPLLNRSSLQSFLTSANTCLTAFSEGLILE